MSGVTLVSILEKIDEHAQEYCLEQYPQSAMGVRDHAARVAALRAEIGVMITQLRASRAKTSGSRRGMKPGHHHPGPYHICPGCRARGCFLPLCVSCRIKAKRAA